MAIPVQSVLLQGNHTTVALLDSLYQKKQAFTRGRWPGGRGKLNLSADKTGASPPLTGFSIEWENAWARNLHFYGIFLPLRL